MKLGLRIGLCRHRRASLLGALAIILCCLFFWALASHEPVYQKKGLSRWIRQLNESDADGREAAVVAIRAMENRAVPALIARLPERDGRLRKALISFTGHFPSLRDRYISVEVERGYAASALGAIGLAAKAAIPALITASMDTNSFCAARAKAALIQIGQGRAESVALPAPETWNLTNWLQRAETLLALGSNVQASADEMVAAIGTNNTRRFEIVEALGWNNREPHASVLLLRGLLKDKEPGIRMNVLNMLISQRAFARGARKDVLQCTNDSDANVRANARFALLFAFPEQASSDTSTKDADSTEPKAGQRN